MSYSPTLRQFAQLDSRGEGLGHFNRKMAIFNKFIIPKCLKMVKLGKNALSTYKIWPSYS